jgi:hypothetical protein
VGDPRVRTRGLRVDQYPRVRAGSGKLIHGSGKKFTGTGRPAGRVGSGRVRSGRKTYRWVGYGYGKKVTGRVTNLAYPQASSQDPTQSCNKGVRP